MIVTTVLAISGAARAHDSNPVPDVAMAPQTPCMSIVGNPLDLKILAYAADVWSFDNNASIASTAGDVSLLIATGGKVSNVGVTLTFETLNESVKIRDERGNEIQMAPDSSMEPISTVFTLADDGIITVLANSRESIAPNKPPGSKKAILKPVTTCPRVL